MQVVFPWPFHVSWLKAEFSNDRPYALQFNSASAPWKARKCDSLLTFKGQGRNNKCETVIAFPPKMHHSRAEAPSTAASAATYQVDLGPRDQLFATLPTK